MPTEDNLKGIVVSMNGIEIALEDLREELYKLLVQKEVAHFGDAFAGEPERVITYTLLTMDFTHFENGVPTRYEAHYQVNIYDKKADALFAAELQLFLMGEGWKCRRMASGKNQQMMNYYKTSFITMKQKGTK